MAKKKEVEQERDSVTTFLKGKYIGREFETELGVVKVVDIQLDEATNTNMLKIRANDKDTRITLRDLIDLVGIEKMT